MKDKFKNLFYTVKASDVNEEERTIVHLISTPEVDRQGDIVVPEGMVEDAFRNNPVVLFGHDTRKIPVGKNLWLKKDDKGILAKTQFADTESGREIFKLNKDGYLNAWSIGFLPLEMPKYKEGVWYYEKWELLEYSSVPVPANPGALNLAMKDLSSSLVKDILETSPELLKDKIADLESTISELKTKLEAQPTFLKQTDLDSKIKEINKTIEELESKVAKKLTSIVHSIERLV